MRSTQAFTLVEVLLTVALLSILGGLLFPVGFSFFQSQILDEAREGLVGVLRSAQALALAGTHDTSFGVKILPSAYVLFEGDAYASRVADEDLSFSLPADMEISGPDEIIFSEGSSIPSVSGTIDLVLNTRRASVVIGEKGVIE